jgi:hypothetical protein
VVVAIFQYTTDRVGEEVRHVWETLHQEESTDGEIEVGPSPSRGAFRVASYRTASGKVGAHTSSSMGAPNLPHLRLKIGYRRFDQPDEEEMVVRVDDAVDLIKKVYLATEERPAFVYGMSKNMPGVVKELGSYPIPASQAGEDVSEIQFVSWLSIFPPSLVDMYGRERLLSAPAWHVEELDDGSILLVGWKDPTEVGGGDLREYFGLAAEE